MKLNRALISVFLASFVAPAIAGKCNDDNTVNVYVRGRRKPPTCKWLKNKLNKGETDSVAEICEKKLPGPDGTPPPRDVCLKSCNRCRKVADCPTMWYYESDEEDNELFNFFNASTTCEDDAGHGPNNLPLCNGDTVVYEPLPLYYIAKEDSSVVPGQYEPSVQAGKISWVATAVDTNPAVIALSYGVIELDGGDIFFSEREDWSTDIYNCAITGGVERFEGLSGSVTWTYIDSSESDYKFDGYEVKICEV